MISTNVEKAILAIALKRRALLPIFFENCNGEFFKNKNNNLIYQEMARLCFDGEEILWSTIENNLIGKVPYQHFEDVRAELEKDAIAYEFGGDERYLLEKITWLKGERETMEITKLIAHNVKANRPYRELAPLILELAEKMQIKESTNEDSSPDCAINEYLNGKDVEHTGIKLGFPSIDKVTDVYNMGEVLMVMGRTTTGKTFMALNIFKKIASLPYRVGLFSLEMSKAAIIERLMQIFFGVDRWELKQRRDADALYLDDFRKLLANTRIYSGVYSISEISQLIKKDDLQIVVIDFLHLVKSDVRGDQYQKITAIMQGIKQMAKERDCFAVILHQLSRQAGAGWDPVRIDHARDSGAVEELSDFILGIWNLGLNPMASEEQKNTLVVKLLKNKRGSLFGIECHFDKKTGIIREVQDGTHQNNYPKNHEAN